jgi:ribonuclease HI
MIEYKAIAYTDGAYSRLRNVGSFGYILQYLKWNKEHEEYELIKEKQYSEQVLGTTSNRMELMAAISALNALTRPCIVEIVSDATYVVDSLNKWLPSFIKDPSRANHDLMIELHKAKSRHKSVTAIWVRGHSNNVRNDRINEIVQKTAGTWKGKI